MNTLASMVGFDLRTILEGTTKRDNYPKCHVNLVAVNRQVRKTKNAVEP